MTGALSLLILAAVLAGLLGLVGLVFDFGRGWVYQTDLQAAVDAAAIAGATQLDGTGGARDRAVLAAVGAIPRNDETFTRRAAGAGPVFDGAFGCGGDGCVMTNGSFRFLRSLEPRLDALTDADARYVEVAAAETLRFAFAGLIGAPSAVSPQARAVASWRRYACGRAALILCNPDEPAGNLNPRAAFDPAPHFGKGMTLRTGAAPGPGAFSWAASVTCDPALESCDIATDTSAVAMGLAQVLPNQACQEPAHGAPAAASDLGAAINMRLDIYPGAAAALDPETQPSPNFLSGLVPAPGAVVGGALQACDFPGALVHPARPFLGPNRHPPAGSAPLDHMGYPRDNCAYPRADGSAPPDNCMAVPPPGGPGGQALGTGVWDLPAYMAHHHPTLDVTGWDFNTCPMGACDLAGDGGVDRDKDRRLSRWEVYAWERTAASPRFGRPQCFGGGSAVLPQAPADSPRASDRRLLGAVVANCRAIAAGFGAQALTDGQAVPLASGMSNVTLFLNEAAGELAPDALYVEIVDPTAIAGTRPLVLRDRVVLSE